MISTAQIQMNASNIALLDQIKSAIGISQRFDALILEWAKVNEQYHGRLKNTANDLKKHINEMRNMVTSNTGNATSLSGRRTLSVSLERNLPSFGPSSVATINRGTAPVKRSLPSTSQVGPILPPKRMKSNDNKMAAARKF